MSNEQIKIGLRKGKIFPPESTDSAEDNLSAALTIMAHFMQWGYMFSEEAFSALKSAPMSYLSWLNVVGLSFFSEIKGGIHNHIPLYQGFPKSVMNKSRARIFFDVLTHNWSNGVYKPDTEKNPDLPEFEHAMFKMIDLGTSEEFDQIFTDLVSINSPLTPTDVGTIEWFLENRKDSLVLPDEIPFKETLCMLASKGIEVPVKTPTDVLRIYTYISTGSPELNPIPPKNVRVSIRWRKPVTKENPDYAKAKFKSLPRSKRRFLLSLLESTGANPKEMVTHRERWVRAGELLHPSEYTKRFPKTADAFDKLRNSKVRSWAGDLDAAFAVSFEKGLHKIKTRPGIFARKLWELMDKYSWEVPTILQSFQEVAHKVSNKVLFELYVYFESRRSERKRFVKPKGSRRPKAIPTLPELDDTTVDMVQGYILDSLKNKYAELPPLGKVWVDPELEKVPMPSNMRNLSQNDRPTIPGQRIPIDPKTKVIRGFVHWFNDGTTPQGCDLDLSAFIFSEDGSSSSHIGWNSSYHDTSGVTYSGDVQNKEGACAEYIDFEVKKLLAAGWKYGVIDVRDYRGNNRGLADYKECVFGTMEREFPESSRTWKPDTITNSFTLKTPSTAVVVAGIDFETMEYFLIDADRLGTVAKSDSSGVFDLMKHAADLPKFSVQDLILLHTEVRGKLVENKEDADTVFEFKDFSHSYEKTAQLMGV